MTIIVAVKAETTSGSEHGHAAPPPAGNPRRQGTQRQAAICKPIATAKLEAPMRRDAANSPLDLDLKAVPGQGGQELELRLSGVPEDAYLTAGTKISPASWSLKPAEAAS